MAASTPMSVATETIHAMGPRAVLVKGGHRERSDRADDLFYDGQRLLWIEGERVSTRHTHGTGCVLSAAIAASLAKGAGLLDAVRLGKAFVTDAIARSLAIGKGIGPVDPLWRTRAG